MESGEQPTLDSPLFVKRAVAKRVALAIGFVVGESVLDLGCGAGLLGDLMDGAAMGMEYVGVEREAPNYARIGVKSGDVVEAISSAADGAFDTVVALEIIEHLPPGSQAQFVREMLRVAARRIIISTPHPDCHRWYPNTEHFISQESNPYHTRLLGDWQVQQYAVGSSVAARLLSRIETGDEIVWGDTGPIAGYLMVFDK